MSTVTEQITSQLICTTCREKNSLMLLAVDELCAIVLHVSCGLTQLFGFRHPDIGVLLALLPHSLVLNTSVRRITKKNDFFSYKCCFFHRHSFLSIQHLAFHCGASPRRPLLNHWSRRTRSRITVFKSCNCVFFFKQEPLLYQQTKFVLFFFILCKIIQVASL